MVLLTPPPMTLAAFLDYDDGTDNLYELENGDLTPVPAESDLNQRIATFLLIYFAQLGVPFYCLRMKTEIAVSSQQAGVRIPDLMVLSEALAAELQGAKRSLILAEMSPPLLVVEVVSPNQAERDYRDKRQEYAARKIPEYWIVDPSAQKVTVLLLAEGFYAEQIYQGEQQIVSTLLSNLSLTAQQVLQA